jgi:hypothetical protein
MEADACTSAVRRPTNGPEDVGLDITIDYLGSYSFGCGTEPVSLCRIGETVGRMFNAVVGSL